MPPTMFAFWVYFADCTRCLDLEHHKTSHDLTNELNARGSFSISLLSSYPDSPYGSWRDPGDSPLSLAMAKSTRVWTVGLVFVVVLLGLYGILLTKIGWDDSRDVWGISGYKGSMLDADYVDLASVPGEEGTDTLHAVALE